MTRSLQPWNTRSGEFSALKFVVFISLLAPGFWLGAQAMMGWLGSKPLTAAIHQSGDWSARFLLLSLAVTPLRFIAKWSDLILVRRMLGLAALAYVLLHLILYVWLEAFDMWKVATEIALRIYLTIGFVAVVGMVALGVTSTDGMIRRMGSVRWNRLHAIVYWLMVLSLVHFAMHRKVELFQPMLMAGLFLWLMGFRALRRWGLGHGWPMLLGLSLATALVTAAVEYFWYATMTGVPAARVLAANLDFEYMIRPMWWVLAAGVTMTLIGAFRTTRSRPRAASLSSRAPSAP